MAAVVVAALGVTFLVTAGPARGDDPHTRFTWVGSSTGSGGDNHSWTDERNWAPQGVPGRADTVEVAPPSGTRCFPAHVDGVPDGTAVTSFYLVERGSGADTCNASLTGGSLTVTGNFTWFGGDLATRVTLGPFSAGMIAGSEAGPAYLGADLEVGGQLTLAELVPGRELKIERPANVHVASTGTLRSQGDNLVSGTSCCTAPSRIGNDGTLQVAGGTLRVETAQLDQRGVVNFDRGTLRTEAAPATASHGARYTGSGTWQFGPSGYPTRLSGTQVLGSGVRLRLGGVDAGSSETLGGSFALAGSGVFDWAGGVLAASATIGKGVRLLAAGTRTGNDARMLGGVDYSGARPVPVRMTNFGTIALSAGAQIATAESARLINASGGRLLLPAGTAFRATRCCTAPDRIENRGAVIVESRASLAGLDYVQVAGRTDVRGGTFPAVYRMWIDGGAVTGLRVVPGSVVNRRSSLVPAGTGVGSLQITGNLTQSRYGTLVLDITRRSRDTVRVSGRAALAGRMVTRGHVPRVGSRLTVLAASRGIARQRVCVTTPAAAARTRHWAIAYRGNTMLLLVRKGRAPRC